MKLEFSRSLKNTQISDFMKICPVGAELFHADKHTTKLIVTFRSFVNMPKIGLTHTSQFTVYSKAMGEA